jgi:hypothetical protein
MASKGCAIRARSRIDLHFENLNVGAQPLETIREEVTDKGAADDENEFHAILSMLRTCVGFRSQGRMSIVVSQYKRRWI